MHSGALTPGPTWQARIQSLGSVNMIICPVIGGFLANLDIRLPFVVGLTAYGAFI